VREPRRGRAAAQVLRLPDFDFASSCYLFKGCLGEIAAWSAAHPGHFPIVIFIHHPGTTAPQSFLGAQYAPALAQLQARARPARPPTGCQAIASIACMTQCAGSPARPAAPSIRCSHSP
jgi:hypothetical protein